MMNKNIILAYLKFKNSIKFQMKKLLKMPRISIRNFLFLMNNLFNWKKEYYRSKILENQWKKEKQRNLNYQKIIYNLKFNKKDKLLKNKKQK